MKKIIITLSIITTSLSLCVTSSTTIAHAQYGASTNPQYTLLEPLPTINGDTSERCTVDPATQKQVCTIDLKSYVIYIFKLAIALAVFLAVVMITWGGFRYMTVESVSGKSDAKEIIQNALLGLLGALASYLILYTINPQLVNLNLITVPQLQLKQDPNVINQAAFNDALSQGLNTAVQNQQQYNTAAQAAQARANTITTNAQLDYDTCTGTQEQCLAAYRRFSCV